jgi:hypothetical protein
MTPRKKRSGAAHEAADRAIWRPERRDGSIGKLKTLELIEGRGEVRAAAVFFEA